MGSNKSHDIQDEVEAFRRQDVINHEYGYFISNKFQRTVEQIRNMVDERGSQPYKDL